MWRCPIVPVFGGLRCSENARKWAAPPPANSPKDSRRALTADFLLSALKRVLDNRQPGFRPAFLRRRRICLVPRQGILVRRGRVWLFFLHGEAVNREFFFSSEKSLPSFRRPPSAVHAWPYRSCGRSAIVKNTPRCLPAGPQEVLPDWSNGTPPVLNRVLKGNCVSLQDAANLISHPFESSLFFFFFFFPSFFKTAFVAKPADAFWAACNEFLHHPPLWPLSFSC